MIFLGIKESLLFHDLMKISIKNRANILIRILYFVIKNSLMKVLVFLIYFIILNKNIKSLELIELDDK